MRILRAGSIVGALVAVGSLVAACGGGGAGPGVASLGSSTGTTAPSTAANSASKSADYLDALRYSACMRTKGVPNFPDPTSNGDFLSIHGILNGVRVDYNSSAYNKANKACTHLLPNGGQPTAAQLQQFLAQALKYTQCLRTHGIPNMPDPVESGGGILQHFPRGVRPNSPQVRAATKACRSLQPGGGGAP